MKKQLPRREFLRAGAGVCFALATPKLIGCSDTDDLDPVFPNDASADDSTDTLPAPTTVYAVLGDELSYLYEMARQATEQLGITSGSLSGSTVFIKPNLVTLGLESIGAVYNPAAGECTKPEIIAGVAEQCLEAGASRVTIGDGAQGTSWDWSTITFLPGNSIEGTADLKAAVDRLKSKYGDDRVGLLCLHEADEWVWLPSSSTDPLLANGLPVAKAFCEADHVISCPVLKSHQWATITVSMKNYVGLTSTTLLGNGFSRCKLHQAYAHATSYGVEDAGIAGSYVDIHKWRMENGKEDFTIVDCSIGIEGNGPHTAPVTEGITIDIKKRNAAGKYFLLASNDLAATDAIAAELMGFDKFAVKQLAMLNNLGFVGVQNPQLSGASLAELSISDWVKPTMHSEDEFYDMC